MSYDESLAGRVRALLANRRDQAEKKMFGGLCFLVEGNMCCGILDRDLMARVGPARYEQALRSSHARPMDFTGRPLAGYVYVSPTGTKTAASLKKWVGWCTEFAETLAPKRKTAAKAAGKKAAGKKAAGKKTAGKKSAGKKTATKQRPRR